MTQRHVWTAEEEVTAAQMNGLYRFGGTGADGALSISSGTTTIDLGNVAVLEKNYTSISITGTGKLAFTNPHANGTVIILKSQGDVVLTSNQTPMIDCSGLGAQGGTNGGTGWGGAGNDGYAHITGTKAGSGTTGGAIATFRYAPTQTNTFSQYPFIFVGAGGGPGYRPYSDSGSAGSGGRGGGGLIIECGGSLNFTTTDGISVAGIIGEDGTSGYGGWSGDGGGGGGGCCLIFYNALTANTGTIVVSGGPQNTGFTNTLGGAGGGSAANAGGGGSGAVSGAGGDGYSLVQENTEFI